MDWYPLWNSLRIALISCAAVFFLGIFAAYYIARLPRAVKGVLDVVLTLPMVLPPTVVGYFLLLLFGARRPLGIFFLEHFGVKLVMNWYSAIFASIVVAFPLMYRTARGAFESFDETRWSGRPRPRDSPTPDLLAGADALLSARHSRRHRVAFARAPANTAPPA